MMVGSSGYTDQVVAQASYSILVNRITVMLVRRQDIGDDLDRIWKAECTLQ